MELAVQANAAQSLRTVGLQSAVDVVQSNPGDHRRRPVEHPRQKAARPRIVSPGLPAGDEIVALVELGEQLRDLGRIVLEIGIDRHDDVSLGLEESGLESGGLAEVAAQVYDDHVRGLGVQLGEHREAVVRGSVVHEDHLPRLARGFERCCDLAVERLDGMLLVVERGDDRKHVRRVSAAKVVASTRGQTS